MRDSIFSYDFPEPVAVPTPEWPDVNGRVFVRCLSADERDDYEDTLAKRLPHSAARLVVLAACDAAGNPIFETGDVERLGKTLAGPVHRLWKAAWKLAAGDGVEAAVKN